MNFYMKIEETQIVNYIDYILFLFLRRVRKGYFFDKTNLLSKVENSYISFMRYKKMPSIVYKLIFMFTLTR